MKREIIITNDGTTTIRIPEWNENYHSSHGAIQEAKHVFIKNGLDLFKNQSSISILEIGYGTGLNAFITFLYPISSNSFEDITPALSFKIFLYSSSLIFKSFFILCITAIFLSNYNTYFKI